MRRLRIPVNAATRRGDERRRLLTRVAVIERAREVNPPIQEGPAVSKRVSELRAQLDALDARIGPLARRASELSHPLWGPLMRAGNDKSHLASQMERYADIYTSRVSNLGAATPFVYLRSSRGSLPHDPGIPGPVEQYRG